MSIIKVVKTSGKTKNSLKSAIEYTGKKAYETCGINCSDYYKQVANDFYETKKYFQKEEGRQYRHYIQSFAPEEVKKDEILKIAKEWAERVFNNHEVFIAIHDDKKHLHAHFIVNTVNFENGMKLHESKKDLETKKRINDEICLKYEIENKFKEKEKGDIVVYDRSKYEIIKKGADITDLAETILKLSKIVNSKSEFILQMKEKGYTTEWKDNKKNITFIIDSNKCTGKKNKFRLSNLQKTFNIADFTKENLLELFEKNRRNSKKIILDNLMEKLEIKDIKEKNEKEKIQNQNDFEKIFIKENKDNEFER